MEKKNILVTGFGPFAGHPINASWESVKLLPALWHHDQIELVIDEIPVSYDFVEKSVTKKWEEHDPIFYVHCGVSHIAKQVTLETLGHNKTYDRPDVDGQVPESNCCIQNDPNCPDELHTILDVKDIVRLINDVDSKVCTSCDPGHYLCDYVFFKSLHESKGRSLFIHVPPLNCPFTAEQLAEIITKILHKIIDKII